MFKTLKFVHCSSHNIPKSLKEKNPAVYFKTDL